MTFSEATMERLDELGLYINYSSLGQFRIMHGDHGVIAELDLLGYANSAGEIVEYVAPTDEEFNLFLDGIEVGLSLARLNNHAV